MKLFYPNLAFEEELTDPERNLSPAVQRIVSELGSLMAFLLQPTDRLLTSDQITWPDHLRHLQDMTISLAEAADRLRSLHDRSCEFAPWGWSDRAVRAAAAAGFQTAANVRGTTAACLVNSRMWNARFDPVFGVRDWPFMQNGQAVFGQLCENQAGWRETVQQLHRFGFQKAVTKPMFSHAARNRLLTNSPNLNAQQQGWLQRRLAADGAVYVEPWVTVQRQSGLQFEILDRVVHSEHNTGDCSSKPAVQFVGATDLITDDAGRYLGSLVYSDDLKRTDWTDAIRFGETVAAAAHEEGYGGPLGIDCFEFRSVYGETAIRPCNDINGRLTMGRLAMALRPLCAEEETIVWRHGPADRIKAFLAAAENSSGQSIAGDVRAISTGPLAVNGQPVSVGSVLVAAKNPAAAVELAKSI